MKRLLALTGVAALALPALGALALTLDAAQQSQVCQLTSAAAATGGSWVATAYGPPWGGIQGDGITATGLNLTAGPPAYEIAVDPRLIQLGSYVHITPNPFGTSSAFYAGDTGGAITGRHIDIYDWLGRASQEAWGQRDVTITPAAASGAGNLLDGVAPTPAAGENVGGSCSGGATAGGLGLTAAQTAHIQADGSALAPREAPAAVKLAIVAGNLIHTLPYPEPDQHYGSLARLWPAYDCSGATSLVLYAAGLLGPTALDSTELESYGNPGPGAGSPSTPTAPTPGSSSPASRSTPPTTAGNPSPPERGPRWRAEPLANLGDGTSYVARHPAGL